MLNQAGSGGNFPVPAAFVLSKPDVRSMLKRLALTALAAAALTVTVRPADANFFERLFGGFRQAPRAIERVLPDMTPIIRAPAPSGGSDMQVRSEAGPRSAYCVRTCDGHYFPVRAQGDMNTAEMCQAFCPSAQTKIFSGGGIDHAVAPDGSHYRDLKTAFLYRKQLNANCTCNGKTPFGLARMDIKDDPTLVRGDMVTTKDGLMAVVGHNQNGPQFAKVNESRLSPRERSQVADSPNRRGRSVSRGAPAETTGSASED
jgi:hypothetical protein